MVELTDTIKKIILGLGVVGISYSSLEAQTRTGSDYIRGSKPDKYLKDSNYNSCNFNTKKYLNSKKYKPQAYQNRDDCNFNKKKHLDSKKYKPQAYENKDDCISRSMKKYSREYNRLKRK
ncbi:MAG TPA: hypothetical protein PLE51_03115 [Candidatus Pacearchaeota archaeon]|nr:hypothetical protein [Candidatus Pacearchaeota archaeon]HOR52628.1 hypothetical protein [Candidatus Pacearchaeota archaeon]HPJ87324.1 hypothetical protein [Candidatus Pacearchaeota archaeon]HQF83061.1 hypothetical protein [Candidatus Pacearchaeota archaeon]HQJ58070.1 hypothetical protein [Candidatus Pacearchaeota archaeon]